MLRYALSQTMCIFAKNRVYDKIWVDHQIAKLTYVHSVHAKQHVQCMHDWTL
jgi:hypothetical protein